MRWCNNNDGAWRLEAGGENRIFQQSLRIGYGHCQRRFEVQAMCPQCLGTVPTGRFAELSSAGRFFNDNQSCLSVLYAMLLRLCLND
jgi:hypothetical protein